MTDHRPAGRGSGARRGRGAGEPGCAAGRAPRRVLRAPPIAVPDGLDRSHRCGKTPVENGVAARYTIGSEGAPQDITAGENGVVSRNTSFGAPAKPQVRMVSALVTPLAWCNESAHPVSSLVTPGRRSTRPPRGRNRAETAGQTGVGSRYTIDPMVLSLVTPLRTQKNPRENSSLTGSAPSARTGRPTGSSPVPPPHAPLPWPTSSSLMRSPTHAPKPHQRPTDGGGHHPKPPRTPSVALSGPRRPPGPFRGPDRLLRPSGAFHGALGAVRGAAWQETGGWGG